MPFGELGAETIGAAAAAGAAACWACSSIIYGRTRLTAWTINFAKNSLGLCIVTIHLLFLWLLFEAPLFQFGWSAWGLLIVSGLIGIVVGDTCYFRSLQILGPRRSLVVATTSPIFGAFIGWSFLNETLTFWQCAGIAVTILGISLVVLDKQARQESPGHYPGSEWLGLLVGLAAAVCQASGGAISKVAMEQCTPLEATFARLLTAFVVALIAFRYTKQLLPTVRTISKKSNLKMLIPAAAMGTWLGIWFSQIGFKNTSVAVATMLMSTGPLFAIPLVRYFDKHKISARAVWGTLIALGGIAIVIIVPDLVADPSSVDP